MMRAVVMLCCGALLAACGADGEPETPTMNATIRASDGGISTGVTLGWDAGPVRIRVGL